MSGPSSQTELTRERIGVPHTAIVAGVLRLAESAGRHVTEATFGVYAERLAGAMTAVEWTHVVAEALDTVDGWTTIARLLRILREQREAAADRNPTAAELDEQQRRADSRAQHQERP